MKLVAWLGVLLSYHPLLLERSYGGGAELWVVLIQILLSIMALLVLVKLSSKANEVYGESFHKFLNVAGIILALLMVVYFLATSSH